MKFRVWRGKKGWHITQLWPNGKIFSTTEAYSRRGAAVRMMFKAKRALQNCVYQPVVEGMTAMQVSSAHVRFLAPKRRR